MEFFKSPVEAVLVSVHPRKQGPDDDRVLVYDVSVDVQVPSVNIADELCGEVGNLLFGNAHTIFKTAVPFVEVASHDVSIGFDPIKGEDDPNVSLFLGGATVKIKKWTPSKEDEPAVVRACFTWVPDSKRDVNLLAEKIEEAIWISAVPSETSTGEKEEDAAA